MTISRVLRSMVALLLVSPLLAATVAVAVPVFGEPIKLTQPDGTTIAARIWGDEFHQRVEDLAGYTLVIDPDDGTVFYAELAPDAVTLRSTGVRAETPAPAWLRPGIRRPADVVADEVLKLRQAAGHGLRLEDKESYPIPADEGAVRGIALLVDFSDEPATMDPSDVEAFLNQVGYAANGNNGSVRDYFADISGGRLDLTHEVTPFYYRAAHPKAWYEDPYESQGWRARQLVEEAIASLDRHGFDFSAYDANGDGYVDLVSCFYAGAPSWYWGKGLWPQAGEFGFHADGVIARIWQISPLRDALALGIPCHEIGHALCQWPDLYDTGGNSWGVGLFCLMSNPNTYTNPLEPCGPLKYLSGWTENVLLDGVMTDVEATAGDNRVFYVPHPTVSTEFYLVENRRRSGRDLSMPDEGLAIYHVDWRGDNNREAMLPDIHYMVSLMQADGRYDLEHDANWGDDTDLFGEPGPTHFGPDSQPPARWWRGLDAPMFMDHIGPPGDTIVFDFHDGIGVHPLQIDSDPAALDAPWVVSGADGYLKSGRGTRLVHVPVVGSYVVTWKDIPGWLAPPAATVLVTGSDPGPAVSGVYTHPPFAMTDVPALAGAAAGRGGCLVDLDDDGDLDVFLGREDAGDLLLRNDGAWQFTPVTPPVLAATGPTLGSAWADVDGDGDQDVYVVRRGQPGLLLRQTAPGVFADSPEMLESEPDSVVGAVWLDYDGDGRLDLHLVRDGMPDLLLRAPDEDSAHLKDFEHTNPLPGNSFARTVAGAWCDYDADGRLDLYMVNNYGENMLGRSVLPGEFMNANHGGLGLPWRGGASAWGDYDNDGDFDLYCAQDGGADMLFTQYNSTFVIESGAYTNTPGAGRDVVWADFDNDGHLDLYLARAGQDDLLLIADGEERWNRSPLLLPETEGMSIAAVAGDLDNDGGVDLTLDRDGEPPVMLRNTLKRGHWLMIDPVGHGALRHPAGAVVRVHAGNQVLMRQVTARSGPSSVVGRLHFGLGAANLADSLSVTWPNGAVQVMHNVEADQILKVVQPTPGGTGGGDGDTPDVTRLLPAWPNPFNPSTNVAFDLARAGQVRLMVYDVAGRRVAELHAGELPVGRHTFRWDGRDYDGRTVSAGVYLVRLAADGGFQSRRLALVK